MAGLLDRLESGVLTSDFSLDSLELADEAQRQQAAKDYAPTETQKQARSPLLDAIERDFDQQKNMLPSERARTQERITREAGQIAENTRNMGDRSYLGASAISGIQSAAAVTAGLINEVVGVNDQDLAEAFKDRPQELEQIRNGLGSIFARRAREYGQASRDTMEQVAPDQQEQYSDLKYATLDPSKAAYLSPVRILGDAIQSLPTTAALALTAYLTKGAASKGEAAALAEGASAEAARQAGINAATSMAARFGAASEGVIGAEQQRGSTQAQVMTINFEKSPAYHDLLKQGYSPETAKLFLAARAGNEAGLDAGVIDAATNLVGGQVLGKIIGEGGSIIKRTAKGVANEGVTELVQSGGEQLAQNEAQQKIDPNQSLVDGVLESSLQGLMVGGLTGGLAAATFGRKEKPGIVENASAEAFSPTEEDIDSPIPTEIIQKGKAELAAVTAKNDINELLAAAGLPGVGERVTLTKPDGSQHVGTLVDVFQGDEDAPGTGVKLAMDDGTTFSEYLDTLRDAKYTLGRFKDSSPEDISADMEAPAPEQVDFILPAQGRITSPFGHRTAPKEGASTDHGGVDIALPVGTPVGATAGGTVFATGSGGKRGNWIEIDHGNGLHSRYFHLDSIDVEKGDAVGQGDIIGKSGATGNVTGPHLHWSVLKNGTAIDPMTAGLKGPGTAVLDSNTTAETETKPNILDEPLITNRQETVQPEALPAIPEDPATSQIEPLNSTTPPVPAPTFKDTPSGKGFVLSGATAEQIAEIKRRLPNVDMVPNNRGEITFSKKREAVVRETIDRMTASTVLNDSSQQSSGDGSRQSPIVVTHEDHMQPLMDRVNTEPTEAQKEAGNYTKGHVQVQGIDITIENPKGSERSGVDPNGEPWSVKMPNHYGYVKRTTGADAENVDVYIGPNPQSETVFVVDQQDADTGKFDEHKAMLGYSTLIEAERAYRAGFSDGRGGERLGAVTSMSIDGFKQWLKTEPQKPAAEAVQPDMLGGQDMTESQLAARDNAQSAIDAARSEEDASDELILKTIDDIEKGRAGASNPLDPVHYTDRDAPEAIVHAVRKNPAIIPAIRAALGDKRTAKTDKRPEQDRVGFLPSPWQDTEDGEYPRGPSKQEQDERDYLRAAATHTAEEKYPGENRAQVIARDQFIRGATGEFLPRTKISDEGRAFAEKLKRERSGEKSPAEITRENLSKQPGAQKRAAGNEARTMRDWSNTQIPNYEDRQRSDGDGGATKEAFLKDGKDYANAVAAILSDRGFSAPIIKAKSSKGSDKPGKAVRVDEGGPAVSGDVILKMYRADGSGVYMDIGTALAGPNGGISIMARYVQRGVSQSGPNQWFDDKRMSAKAMADKLEKIADQAPKLQPTNQEMLKAAKDSGRLEIIGIGGKTGEEGKAAFDQASEVAKANVRASDEARMSLGRHAFEEGKPRVPPSEFSLIDKTLWLRGWDRANLAAPVDQPEKLGKYEPTADPRNVTMFVPVDEDIVPLTMNPEDFGEVLDEWGMLFADPPETVQLAKKAQAEGYMSVEDAQKRIDSWKEHARQQNPYGGSNPQQENSNKTVLSLFDLSGEWSRPWEEAGYNVLRFDIQNDSELGDVNNFNVEFFNENFDIQDVYAILAAVPCTDFASSGARHFAAKDADGRTELSKELVHQTLRTIEYFRPTVWAIENPVGRIANLTGLPKAAVTFNPNDVGDPYTKKTILWGKMNGDLPVAPVEPTEGSKMHRLYGGKSMATKNARSVTPEGFSYAFFMANNYADMPAEMKLTSQYPEVSGAVKQALKAGVSEQRIHDLMDDTYGNYEYEDAREALIKEVSKQTGEPARKPKPEVSANTVFTDDAAEKARAILKAKLSGSQLNSGIDPEVMQAGITLAGYHIEKGARTFAAYAQAMIDDLGDVVKPYLRSWYEGVRYHPAMAEAAREMSSAEDIGRAQADLENGRGNQGSLRQGNEGPSPENAERAEPNRSAPSAPERQGEGSAGDVRRVDSAPAEASERSSARSGSEAGSGTGSSGSSDRVSEQDSTGRGRGNDTAADDAKRVTGQNWSIKPGSLDEARGAALKARDNVRAVEIVKELDRTGAPATREQQEALAKYVGWGGLKNAFNETNGEFPKGFEIIGPRLKELLTQEEYDTARRSIQYAHYTAEKVVRPMWDAAVRLGFKGGRVFEPGMGTGNFLGMMPPEIAANTQYAGLEFDYITARIAQLLYPQSGIQHADFTKVPLAKNAYDLVIGNPPFSGTVIRSDPEYGKLGFVLHDFFFAKSIDAVRPGGLLMFVTSAGTMNKVGSEARQYLADRADLVGAVRLAGDAFKENAGTEVTTDIVVLRKRLPGEAPGNMDWVETVNKELPNRDGGKTTGSVSRYFEQHPDMVLGEEGFFDKLAAGERYAVRARPGQDTGKELQRALESLGAAKMADWQTDVIDPAADFESEELKDGSYYLKDGKLYQQRGQIGVPVEGRGKGTSGGMSAKDQERVRGLVPIRDALRDVFKHDLAGRPEKAADARKVLNREYDRFVQKFGPINKAEVSIRRPTVIQQESARNAAREEVRLQGGFFDEGSFDPRPLISNKAKLAEIAAARRAAKETAEALGREWDEGTFEPDEMPVAPLVKRPNIDPFMDDQEGYRLRAIEHFNDDTGEAKKGRIFFENVITKEKIPEINSPQDALLYVLNKRGYPDLDQIASLAKVSRGQAIEALGDHIFKVPGQGETYQTREQYLSGNVRKKLEIAKVEAERDSALERNVEALEAVQPAPLGPSDISANLGMPWIPGSIIEDFGRELGLSRITAKYSSAIAQWRVEGDNNSAAARSEWGTADRGAIELMNAALNRTEVKVYTKVYDPQTGTKRDVIDPEATQAAQDKVLQLKEKFASWIWSDPNRADMLAGIYNRDYNNLVAPVYDGSYLTTPGISSEWSWRPHQTRVIARIIQSGNTYMAHAVGAGKTSAMIGAGMEMRRLGLVRKPMYVVPNHMLGQFTKEFYEQYPTAKIMVADDKQFHTDRRKQFIANVAANDLDAVIITHSSFGFIPMSDEFLSRMIKERVDEFRDILRELKSDGGAGDRFTQRNIEKQIENLEQKLEGRARGGRKDSVFTFEEMGTDFLFVDEAHLFRKLDFATKMNNVRGIDPNGSEMSFDLFAKTRYLESINPMRSHVLASGTPVTNTMAELYSLSRYQQSQELKDRGIDQFDAWAGAFGDTVTALEQDPAGGYKPQTRFAKFVNVPELSAMVRQVMDVVTPRQLEQYVVRPKIKGGGRRMVLAQPGPDLQDFQENLKLRMDAISKRKGPPRKGDDILLSVIGDGRKAAIDMRLVDAGLTRDEGSKLELLIDNVSRIAKETAKKGFHKPQGDGYSAEPHRFGAATQMIFSDLGINGDFPVHKYIANELVRRGLPKDQVAIISDFKSHVARQRLFNDMNEGKVRVLIGSVPKMGTGVNAQRQLYAIHNLDPQWYPANDEQRIGRGLRQGNQNPEIEIIDYSTKGTYDSQMWQLMETKARFIEGFFNGDPTMRSMEDLGEASQYEQAKALTTADPRIMEMTQYKQDLERAMLRKGAHEREQFAMRTRIAAAKDTIRSNEAKLPFLAKDIEQRQDISGDAFKATVMGQEFDERSAWGEAVKERVDSLVDQEKEGRSQKVGEIGGFALTADIVKIGRDWLTAIHMNFNGDRQEQVSASTPAGIATSIGNMLRNIEGRVEKAQLAIEQAEKQIADFTPQIGKPFTGQPEIDELKSKVDAIEAQLTAEAKAREAQSSSGQQPVASVFSPPTATRRSDRPFSEEEAEAIKARLRKELAKLDPQGRISLEIVDKIFSSSRPGVGVQGLYFGGAGTSHIQVAIRDGVDSPLFVLSHEVIHAFRDFGLFTESEWLAMERYVLSDRPLAKQIMKSVEERYPTSDKFTRGMQIEEAIADLFGQENDINTLVKDKDGTGFVFRAFQKVITFLKALLDVMRSRPSYEFEAVFDKIKSGEIGSRAPSFKKVSYGAYTRASIIGGTSAAPDPETVSEALAPAQTLVGKLGETFDEWRTWAQDRMLPLMRTQTAAERILGRPLEEHENPYLGEELMSGKVGAQLEHLSDKLVAPLFEAMKAENISVDELESYLYARHAPERNEQIDKINPEMDGRGSGMSNVEAEAIMNRIDDEGRTKSFEAVARYVDGIIKFAQDTRVETELLSEDQLEAMREAYKHYVPLRGFEELDGAEGERPKQGSGISIRGPESKRAFGRRSKADDILAYTIMQAEEAIIRGQKNMVAKKLYNLARQAKDGDFWKISPVTMRRKLNPLTGFVETVPDRTLSAEDAPYTVSLKVDGKEKRVTMNKRNPAAVRLAESMRRLDEQQVGKVIQFMGKVNRWLSAANTSFNPEFVITNAFRDIQTAGINLAGIDVKGIELGTLKDYFNFKALKGSMKGAFGNDSGEWGKWYREFVDEGGRVFFNQVQDLDSLKAKIEREFKHSKDVNLTPQTAALKAYSGMKAIGEWIGNVNNGVENAIRLSAYKNGRERGMSRAQAASLAKNLTVNFNRRGAGGTTVNALYLFYNASMQGTARMLVALKSKRVQKVVIGIALFSAALDALNMMVSGRDDDDELYYDKIADFEKSRNLIIMTGSGAGDYIKLPMPYGYNVFAALGRSMSEIMRGRNVQNTIANFASTAIDSFNPIGGAGSVLNIMAPTIADPVVDLTRNRDFADRPIMPDQAPYQPPKPDNQRYWGSVNPLWKNVTDSLNKVSGGDDVQPGFVDMSPETFEYMFGVTFGAAGAFYDRTLGLGQKIVGVGETADEPIEMNDIPLVRKVIGSKPGWYDKAAMYARMEQVKQTLEYAKGYAEKGDREGFQSFVSENLDVVSMEGQLKQTRREMREIKKERSEAIIAKDRGKIDAARFKEINTRLDDIQEKVIANFNRTYIKTVKRPVGPS